MKKMIVPLIILMLVFSMGLTGCAGTDSNSATSTVTPAAPGTGTATSATIAAATSPSTTSNSPESTQPSGQAVKDILNASVAAIAKMTTLKMDIDSNMIIEVSGGPQPGKMTMRQVATGSVDSTAKKMLISMNIAMDIPTQGKQDIAADMYASDGWMYMKTSMPAMGEQWMKMKLTDELWAQQSGISNMSEFLQSAAGAVIEGSQIIKGVDCYVIKITPEMSVLGQWIQDQLQSSQSGLDISQVDFTKAVKRMSIKEWVAKESKLLMQEQMSILIEMGVGDLGLTAGSLDKMAMDINATMTYSDFGKPVTVVIPQEAQNAQEIPLSQ